MKYVPLHIHTEYSLLDSTVKIKDLFEFAKENNWSAVAITDHGNMCGAMEFYATAKEAGIKPIIGCEIYVCEGELANNSKLYHLVLLAKNNKGYENLKKIVDTAYTRGFYNKPRVNRDFLKEYSEGLICLSACIAGELGYSILDGDMEKAKNTVKFYKNLYGEDYYIELQDHGMAEQKVVNPKLIKIAKKFGIKLIITNDSHYLKKADAGLHDALVCVQTKSDINDPNRFKFPSNEFYVKTPEELRESFKWLDGEIFEEAIRNTVEVAGKCDLLKPLSCHI